MRDKGIAILLANSQASRINTMYLRKKRDCDQIYEGSGALKNYDIFRPSLQRLLLKESVSFQQLIKDDSLEPQVQSLEIL